ncbi:MAG: PAS domain S-box protein [FCB group bacterium]|nr:PAS domain S-box protein [FCB group bacterium]
MHRKDKKTIGICFGRKTIKTDLKKQLEQLDYNVFCLNPDLKDTTISAKVDLFIIDTYCAGLQHNQLFALREQCSSDFTSLPLFIALESSEDPTPWLKLGFDDVIPLPINRSLLKARLKAWLTMVEDSRQRFKSLFENVQIGLYRSTPEGRVTLANPALVKMLGFDSLEDLQNRNLNEEGFEPGYSRQEFISEIEEKGSVRGLESRWTKRDGTTLYIRESAQVVKDDEGNILYYEGTVEDISDKVLAERAREASEYQYAHLVETLPEAILTIDHSGKILYASIHCRDYFEQPDNEPLEGKSFYTFFTSADIKKIKRLLNRAGKTNRVQTTELRLIHKDQMSFPAEVNLSRAADTSPLKNTFIITLRNISEQVADREAVQKRVEELTTLHEFSNKLNVSLNFHDVAEASVTDLRSLLEADVVLLFHREGSDLKLIRSETSHPKYDHHHTNLHKVGKCLCGLAVSNGKSIFSLNIHKDPRCVWDECKAAGLTSFAAIPLFWEQKIIGVLGLASSDERDFQLDEDYIGTLVNQISICFHNATLYQEIDKQNKKLDESILQITKAREVAQDAEARFRALTESASAAIFIYQEDNFIYVNPMMEKITGFSSDQLLKMNFWDIVHPDHKDMIRERGKRRLEGERVRPRYDFKIITAKNELRWVDFTAAPIIYEGQKAAIGTAYDITERKLAEERNKEQAKALREIVEGASAETGEEFFKSLVKYLTTVLSVDLAFVGEITDPEKEIVMTRAFYRDGRLQKNFQYNLKQTPCFDVCRQGLTVIRESVQTAYPEDKWLQENDVEAYCGIPIRGEQGNVLGNLVVMHRTKLEDTTLIESILQLFTVRVAAELERIHSILEIQQRTEELRTVLNSNPIPMVVLNENRDIVDGNPAAEQYLTRTGSALSGRFPGEVLSCLHRLDDPQGCGFGPECEKCELRTGLLEVIENKSMAVGIETDLRLLIDGDYHLRFIKLNAAYMDTQAGPRIVVAFEDITPLKEQSEHLSDLVERLTRAQKVARMGFIDWNCETDELQCSDEIYRILGRTGTGFLTMTDFINDVINKPYRKELFRQLKQAVQSSTPINVDIQAKTVTGEEIWLNVRAEVQPGSGANSSQQGLLGTIVDITDRKSAEEQQKESELWLKTIIETEPECVKILTPTGILVEMNRAGLNMIEAKSLDEVKGKAIYSLIAPEYRPDFKKMLESVCAGNTETLTFEMVGLKGTRRWMESHNVQLRNPGGKLLGLLAVTRDITEQKRANDLIAQSLAEKEVLLKEIHHRVKNNLQVVYSLLNMQIHQMKNEEAREVLRESQSRIRSMALVHEKLYQSENQSRLPAREFIRSITRELFGTYSMSERINLVLEIPDITLDINNAVPCGLVINELVSNALKYAFPTGRHGTIKISIKPGKKRSLTIIVADDGIGLPADKKFETSSTLGMTLVRVIVLQQLEGELKVTRSKGTKITINLPWR